jgi:putative hydrolase of the HAD superfamily
LQLFHEHEIEKKCQTNFDNFITIYEEINHDLWHKYSLQLTTKEELRYLRFHKAFLHFKYDDLELSHHWANEYLMISPYKTHLIEGTLEVLDYLQDKYELHIITNGFKEVQHIKLHACNLYPYFKNIIISEEHGFNKPDLKIFELAQSLSNSSHQECVMIGDNFDTDIMGALNANWKAIYLAKENKETLSNHLHINSLIELKSIL